MSSPPASAARRRGARPTRAPPRLRLPLAHIAALALALWAHGTALAQDDIGTQTVTVVKSYAPTVADAHKVPTEPVIGDSLVLRKRPIAYTLFSVPVASTFAPAKGRAAAVERPEAEPLKNTAVMGTGTTESASATTATPSATFVFHCISRLPKNPR